MSGPTQSPSTKWVVVVSTSVVNVDAVDTALEERELIVGLTESVVVEDDVEVTVLVVVLVVVDVLVTVLLLVLVSVLV